MKKVSIALQGGGSHGSFAWGVLDRLLEDGRFDIQGISGTSAGGMNAAATVQGLIQGGNERARSLLKDFWSETSRLASKISPFQQSPYDKMSKNYNLNHSPGYMMATHFQNYLSPYDTNPLNLNPFKNFITDFFDFKAVRESSDKKIFLGATHVLNGKIKVFTNKDFTPEALMASACLPFLFQAVKVDGEYYWDGGYIANPAIFPLIYECDSKDIIVVQLRNSNCTDVPKTKDEIDNRLKEITYNGCLVHEMRAIYFITKLIDEGKIKDPSIKRMNIHLIKNDSSFKGLNLSSALNSDWDFLTYLYEEGRKTAEEWIKKNYEEIGTDQHTLNEEIFDSFI